MGSLTNNERNMVVIRHTSRDFIGKLISARGYRYGTMYYGQSSFILRRMRMLWERLNLPFKSIWYRKVICNDQEDVLVFEPLCSADYIRWLHKINPDARINLWYWNYAENTVNPDTISDEWCIKWSFSRIDCLRYNMKFNPPPYFSEMVGYKYDIEYDVAFVGKDKGRLEALLKLKKTIEDMGLRTKFVITPDRKYQNNPAYSPEIPYQESMRISSRSRALLDYIEVNNSGQSMRVMECLFLKRKLITNSILIPDYDFYRPENIFILGRDDIRALPMFLQIPYVEIDKKIILKYDFGSFINRFMLTGETTFADEMMCMLEAKSEK